MHALSGPLTAALRTTKDRELILGVRPNDISVVTPAPEHLNGQVTLVWCNPRVTMPSLPSGLPWVQRLSLFRLTGDRRRESRLV
jgi:hypothetical protein